MDATDAPDVLVEPFPRIRPKVTARNAHVWQGGADGVVSTGSHDFTGCMLLSTGG